MKTFLAILLALPIAVPVFAGEKVTICHVPPGNPGNAHTIIISENALKAHLGNNEEGLHGGDSYGSCASEGPSPVPTSTPTANPTNSPTPTGNPTTEPSATPSPTPEPTGSPQPSQEPTPEPTGSPQPSESPAPSTEPSGDPTRPTVTLPPTDTE